MTLCKVCGKKPAQLYIRKKDGKEVRLLLCPDCYRELYAPENAAGAFPTPAGDGSGKRCPVCGTTFADFRATGLLGCARCYAVFRDELLPTVKYLQAGRARHKGTAQSVDDARYDRFRTLTGEQEALRERLRNARARGNADEEENILRRLEEIGRQLSGEED